MHANEPIYKTEVTYGIKNKHGYQRGNVRGRDKSGAWDEYMHTTAYKLDDQQGPSVQHRELSPILSDNLYEKIILKKMNILYV